jgi:hypothetical protein
MRAMTARTASLVRTLRLFGVCVIAAGCANQSTPRSDVNATAETAARVQIAATSLEDTVVVDCELPGKLLQLGGKLTYLTPGRLLRATTLDCRTRGGQYTLGDLSSGTLSLKRWLPLAQAGNAEAQYYVARIYANGMSGAAVDYTQAAHWYQLAADQGDSAALQELGYLYDRGLGVQRDPILALNLQRKAAGMGEELDYAWKIDAAQESAAKQIEELNARLEASNTELVQSRSALLVQRDSLMRIRAEARRSAARVAELKASLEAARNTGSAADAARVSDLEAKLAVSESALHSEQQRGDKLLSDLQARQADLQASLARSQATSLELNEVVAARRSDSASHQAQAESLRAELAQANQRLIRMQQELTEERVQYQRGVQRLAEQHAEIESQSRAVDAGAALLAARQREIDHQQLQLQSLATQLDAAKQAEAQLAATGAARASAADAQNAELRQKVDSLQTAYRNALEQLARQKQELSSLQTKSGAERETLVQQLTLQMQQRLADSNQELAAKMRHIASLEDDLSQLKGELKHLQMERDAQGVQQANAQRSMREDLDAARQEALTLQENLEKAQTDAAREHQGLLQVQSQLEQERTEGALKARDIAALNAEIKKHLATIKADDELVATLKLQLSSAPPLAAMRSVPDSAASGTPSPSAVARQVTAARAGTQDDKYLIMARAFSRQHPGHNYALLIGNSNYRNIPALRTPLNDIRDLGATLEEHYNFRVDTLPDATERDIMLKLDELTRKLEENDSLIVYFAGHGDRVEGPAERAYWLGVEANPQTKEGYLEGEQIQAKIKQMRARQILLVADSCFSGAIAHGSRVTIGRGINERMLTQEMSRRARMVLASGGDAPVPDRGNEAEHSLFATAFIRTLRQNAALLSGEMLAHEVYAAMQQAGTSLHITQVPTYAHLGDANHDFGDFFFMPRPLLLASLDAQ